MFTVRDGASGKYDLRLLSAVAAICAASAATGLAGYELSPALDVVLILGLVACAVGVLLISQMKAGASLRSLQSALDAAPAGIACFNHNQRLTFWNRGYAQLLQEFGVTPALGLRFDASLAAAAAGVFGSSDSSASSGQEFAWGHRPAEFELPDGRKIQVRCDPTHEGGAVAALFDVTAMRQAERLAEPTRQPAAAADHSTDTLDPGKAESEKTLPRDVPADTDATPHRSVDASAARAAPRGRLRILAAEDNLTNQVVLTALLESMDVDLTMTADGEEAVAAYRTDAFDLVLMDIQMPNMGGEDATRAIRAWEADAGLGRTPILAVTANVMPEQIAGYLAKGMDGVIAKPIEVAKLFAGLQSALPLPRAA